MTEHPTPLTDETPLNAIANSWRGRIVMATYFIMAAAALAGWWHLGRPVVLTDAPAEKLQCMSYTPPQHPPGAGPVIPRAQIEHDLRLLATHTECVRTYSSTGGLEHVPDVARELGLKVLLGIWIGTNAQTNEVEIASGISLAQQYREVIDSIIVGNEVLLRHEQSAGQLRPMLQQVREATRMPVTYADVWEFWVRNPELADVASYITIHILPYWEDHPVAIEHALQHVNDIYLKVQETFPGKQIRIGETGWPSRGRQRDGAVPSLVNEARFLREFTTHAARHSIPYNFIEAFDQPWKRGLEGTVGGRWGIYDADGAAKFPFTGPVVEQPYWRAGIIAALLGGVVFALLSKLLQWHRSWRGLSMMALAGYAAGAIGTAQWIYLAAANRNLREWLTSTVWTVIGWVGFVACTRAVVRWLEYGEPARAPAGIAALIESLGHGRQLSAQSSRLLGFTRFVLLFGAGYICLGLVFDARYRDFPLALALPPVISLALLELARGTGARSLPAAGEAEETTLATGIGIAAVLVAWLEGLQNLRALAWSGLCVLLAASVLLPGWRVSRQHHRSQQQADAGQLESI